MLRNLFADIQHLALVLPLNEADEKALKQAARVLGLLSEYRDARILFDEACESGTRPDDYLEISGRFEKAERALLREIEVPC